MRRRQFLVGEAWVGTLGSKDARRAVRAGKLLPPRPNNVPAPGPLLPRRSRRSRCTRLAAREAPLAAHASPRAAHCRFRRARAQQTRYWPNSKIEILHPYPHDAAKTVSVRQRWRAGMRCAPSAPRRRGRRIKISPLPTPAPGRRTPASEGPTLNRRGDTAKLVPPGGASKTEPADNTHNRNTPDYTCSNRPTLAHASPRAAGPRRGPARNRRSRRICVPRGEHRRLSGSKPQQWPLPQWQSKPSAACAWIFPPAVETIRLHPPTTGRSASASRAAVITLGYPHRFTISKPVGCRNRTRFTSTDQKQKAPPHMAGLTLTSDRSTARFISSKAYCGGAVPFGRRSCPAGRREAGALDFLPLLLISRTPSLSRSCDSCHKKAACVAKRRALISPRGMRRTGSWRTPRPR
jgi:hypothetical protein